MLGANNFVVNMHVQREGEYTTNELLDLAETKSACYIFFSLFVALLFVVS